MAIHTIAWEPPEGSEVLAEGVGGSRPPTLCKTVPDEPWGLWCGDREHNCGYYALLLQHDGQPVPRGMDEGRRALAVCTVGSAVYGSILEPFADHQLRQFYNSWDCMVEEKSVAGEGDLAVGLARALVHALGGRVLMLDAGGREER